MNKTRVMAGVILLLGICVASLQAQPIAHYTFADGTAKDISGNGNDGILLGSAAVVDDPERGKVLGINESGMQVDGPFDITSSFTLSAWVKLDIPRTGRYYFGGPWWFRTDNQGGPEHYWIEVRYPGGNFLNKIDTRVQGNAQGQLDGQWHHLVLTLPEDGAFKAYFDGVEAPFRDADPVREHDFGGAVGPLFFGTQNADGGNAIAGYMDDIRVFNYAVTPEELAGLQTETQPELASDPTPASGATDVPLDQILGWVPGEFADTHNVYLGATFEDVNDAGTGSPLLIAERHGDITVDAGPLEFGHTYYWRVDEVNAPPDSTVFKGEVWSFTVEPVAYPIETVTATGSDSSVDTDPMRTVDGSGLSESGAHSTEPEDMWLSDGTDPTWIQYEFDRLYKLHSLRVWNSNNLFEQDLGYGFKDVTIEYSQDGVAWETLGDVEFAQAPASDDYVDPDVIDLSGVAAKHVRLTANSNWSLIGLTKKGLSEVQFLYIPVVAREPQPQDGSEDVHPGVELRWRAGREATAHDLLFAEGPDALASVATTNVSRYDATELDLQLGSTYSWQVNEVNDAETPSVWEGQTWSFSTQPFLVVDDFERYTDDQDAGEAIFQTWADGFEDSTNGSLVGYGESSGGTFGERTIVHGDRQSMPLFYDNAGVAYSEAERTFDEPQDWSRFGVTTLVLHFYEDAENTGGRFYVEVNGERIVYEDPSTAAPPGWQAWRQWNIDLSSLGVNLGNVTSMAIGVEGSGNGLIYVDDIRLYSTPPAEPVVTTWFEAESGTIVAPMLKYAGDATASDNIYVGTDEDLGDSTGEPPAEGLASYAFTASAGTYQVSLRVVSTSGSDSFWVRMPGATTNTANHASGWVQFSGIPQTGDDWHWEPVHSNNDGNQVVQFTLTDGQHTLEIAPREDGTLVDAVAVVKID